MKKFYKILENGYPAVGSGKIIPQGYSEYLDSNMPQDLQDALQVQNLADKERLIKNLVQNHLDSTAKDWGYDNIYTAITYVGDEDITYNKEGQMFKKWRSAVWVYVNQELAKLEQGLRAMPTEEEVIAELPLLDTYRIQLGL